MFGERPAPSPRSRARDARVVGSAYNQSRRIRNWSVSSPLDRELAADDASPYLPRWARDRAAQDRTPSSNVESFEPDPDTHWPEQRFVIDGYRVPVSLAPPPPPGTPWHVRTVRSRFGRLGVALAIATGSVVGLFSIGISTAPDATDKRPTSFESRF